MNKDQYFMQTAIKLAHMAKEKDDVPVGAVIAYKGEIIAKACNQVELLKDPTAHAEMIAITQASIALSQKWLHDCTLYVTVEPCPMCAGALVLARIKKIHFGATDPKTGACGSLFNIARNNDLNHKIEVERGLCEEECASLMTEFFRAKRA